MKKFVAMLAALMMAILAIVPMTGACAESQEELYVWTQDGNALNLRSGASTSASVLAKLGVGKTVTLINPVNDTWSLVSVKLDGKTVKGYVMTKFIDAEDPAYYPQTFTKVKSFQVTVTPSNGDNGHVNMRSEANPKSVVRSYLYKGDVLTVKAESHAYYQVRDAQGRTGYVLKAFVSK